VITSFQRLSPFQRWLRWGLWLVYIAVIGYAGVHHHPWCDEVDTWVMVRDANFHEFITYFSYSGHPPLWYIANLPFARWMGLPVEAQKLFPFCLSSSIVWLLLFRSPFPLWLLVPCIFSVHMIFAYGVLARGYPLLLLLLFIVPILHPTRFTHPFRYASIIALLFQTEVFAWPIAGMLTLFFAYDCWKQRKTGIPEAAKNVQLQAGLIPIISSIIALALLWPHADANPSHLGLHFLPGIFATALIEGFVPSTSFAGIRFPQHDSELANLIILVVMSIILSVIILTSISLQRTRSAWLFGAWLSGFYVIISCIYAGAFWHCGLIPLFLLFNFWFAQADAAIPPIAVKERVSVKLPVTRHVLYILLTITYTLSVFIGIDVVTRDVRHPLSGASDAAVFLHTHAAADTPIISIGCHRAVSVAAYFSQGSIWLASQQRFTNVQRWDYNYYQCTHTPQAVMIERSLEHFKSVEKLWLVSADEIKNASDYNLIQRYFSPGYTESYWIYEKQKPH